jgi:hypothetical protein
MQTAFAPMGTSVNVAATASSVGGSIVLPSTANALYICNTSATLYVTAAWGSSAPTAILGGGATQVSLPPLGSVLVEANPTVAFVAAIGSGAGPTTVCFTPCRVLA